MCTLLLLDTRADPGFSNRGRAKIMWTHAAHIPMHEARSSLYVRRGSIQGGPERNATTLIVNFMHIVDETELFFILFGRTFIFQQNDTMIISFG